MSLVSPNPPRVVLRCTSFLSKTFRKHSLLRKRAPIVSRLVTCSELLGSSLCLLDFIDPTLTLTELFFLFFLIFIRNLGGLGLLCIFLLLQPLEILLQLFR